MKFLFWFRDSLLASLIEYFLLIDHENLLSSLVCLSVSEGFQFIKWAFWVGKITALHKAKQNGFSIAWCVFHLYIYLFPGRKWGWEKIINKTECGTGDSFHLLLGTPLNIIHNYGRSPLKISIHISDHWNTPLYFFFTFVSQLLLLHDLIIF